MSYEFLRNETKELVEFEVVVPRYFRVVVERRSDPEVHTLILPSIDRARGTTIDLRMPESKAVQEVRHFVRTLVSLLSVSPWTGLRLLESHKEKRKWLELIKKE